MEAFDWFKQVGTVPSSFKFVYMYGALRYIYNLDDIAEYLYIM